jgi:hypothetical protein
MRVLEWSTLGRLKSFSTSSLSKKIAGLTTPAALYRFDFLQFVLHDACRAPVRENPLTFKKLKLNCVRVNIIMITERFF